MLPDAIAFGLHPNYPNPFTGVTQIPFDVEKPVHVQIAIYDMLGRQVQTLIDAPMAPGQHRVSFDATGFAPGMYHYRIQAGGYRNVRSMIVLR